ncbi:unnamed protein product, partial [Rotaria socialis]
MFQLADGQDVILAGDFNATPSDICYKVFTEEDSLSGNLPKSSNYEIFFRPNVEHVFKSAYREKNASEPV